MIDADYNTETLELESLFHLSYGMCVISSKHGKQINGCVVNTVFQIVPEPPMVAVSVNKEALTHEFIEKSGVFAASILSEDAPKTYLGRFGFRSGRDFDKFRETKYEPGRTGAPILLYETVSCIEAELMHSIDVHTHTLFIGKVVACRTIDETKEPMTYRYYRDVKHGRTPKSAATYIQKSKTGLKRSAKAMQKYRCIICDYIYDPAKGDPENNIEPGTSFDDLPDDWVCPDCGAGKDEFEPA